ncbi:MAG: hypothetical protein AMJ70_01615 [Dehalococcoidia bacterium SG8_51_3]|nr:MAG: hypothetical protein AMJ70_01615 [Dehalococcoidia bacterium SG8_51_3]
MKKTILKWELSGIILVFLLGALLHFVFEWSGESRFVGAIASVNESVWEHFKLGFWPMCMYAALEYRFIRASSSNFLTAKAVAVYFIPIITALIFYAYTAAIGEEILIIDILIFAVAITAGQLVSYKIITAARLPGYAAIIAAVFIVILALILILFTFYPPHLPIFLDANTGTYGIPR